MKILIINLLFIQLAFSGGRKPKPEETSNSCDSDNYCTYKDMPLESQSSLTLKWYVNEKTGNNRLSDPGWCGPVAGMMALYGIKNHNKKVKYNSWLDDKTSTKYGTWKFGLDAKTDFKGGGTSDHYAGVAFSNLINKATNTKDKYYIGGSYYPLETSETIKNSIKARKHVEYISVCKFKVENKRTLSANLNYSEEIKDRQLQVGYYEVLGDIEGCHALAINGYDGNRLIVYDPWGRAYTVDVENIFYANESGTNVYPNSKTRITYGSMKKRTWLNFSHFMQHGGKKGTHTVLMRRQEFAIYEN